MEKVKRILGYCVYLIKYEDSTTYVGRTKNWDYRAAFHQKTAKELGYDFDKAEVFILEYNDTKWENSKAEVKWIRELKPTHNKDFHSDNPFVEGSFPRYGSYEYRMEVKKKRYYKYNIYDNSGNLIDKSITTTELYNKYKLGLNTIYAAVEKREGLLTKGRWAGLVIEQAEEYADAPTQDDKMVKCEGCGRNVVKHQMKRHLNSKACERNKALVWPLD